MRNLTAVESIFTSALTKATPEERAAYLDQACGPDAELRRHVESLLEADGQAAGFLNGSAPAATIDQPPAFEQPGTFIGPYKLLQQIGEGGMGVVYMAEQQEPVRRKVALKIIKPGMDSQQVIARFEAERQALALMDHQNIAKVLDAGTTESGRPYFVMELVHGVPITKFCDDNQLTPRQRLELFVPVCQAVQHAHQKGIIHRDLKPSNVLVTHVRRQAGAQGDRLRRGQGDRAAAHREDAVHAVRHPGRHLRVHEPRAGGDERLRRGHPQRHLLAGRAALRAADRHDAAGAAAAARGGLGRDRAADQGGGAAAAEHPAEQLGGGAGRDLAAARQRRRRN